MEKYEILALKDVTVLAYVSATKFVTRSGFTVAASVSEKQWLSLSRGELKRIGLVVGVHPGCLPDHTPTQTDDGFSSVLVESYSPETLPREFFGLFSLKNLYS